MYGAPQRVFANMTNMEAFVSGTPRSSAVGSVDYDDFSHSSRIPTPGEKHDSIVKYGFSRTRIERYERIQAQILNSDSDACCMCTVTVAYPAEHCGVGLQFSIGQSADGKSTRYTVCSIREFGQASRAGVRVGDELEAVGGVPVTGIPHWGQVCLSVFSVL